MQAVVIWGLCICATVFVAVMKSRSVVGWFFLGVLLGPIAVLLVLLSPSLAKDQGYTESRPAPGPGPASDAPVTFREEFEALKRDFQTLSRRLVDLDKRLMLLKPQEQTATPQQPASAPAPAPVSQAAPIPVLRPAERVVPLQETPRKGDIETDLGKFWLNKIGIVIFSLGIAFLLMYSFARFGPVAKICAGYMIALALFIGGVKLERLEVYSNYGKVLLGGAWAIAYFTTYAMHHFEASRLIESELIDLYLLALVAYGMIVHSLRYKSEALTAMALLIGYVTCALGNVGYFTLASAGILAVVCLVVVYKMRWVRFIFLGILLTYMTHAVWVVKQIAAAALPVSRWSVANVAFFFDLLFLSLYWALFTAAIHVIRDRDPETEKKLAAANVMNFLLFFAMAFPKFQVSYPDHTFNMVYGLGLVYMALAAAMEAVRKDRLFISNILMAVSLVTLSIPLRFLPHETILVWLVELPFLVFAGFAFERRVFRYLGFGLALLTLVRVLFDYGPYFHRTPVFGAMTMWQIILLLGFLSSAACYVFYHLFLGKKDKAEPDTTFRNVYSGLAVAYLTLLIGDKFRPEWFALGTSLESLALCVAGALLLDRFLRGSGLVVLGLAALRYVFWDRESVRGSVPQFFSIYGPMLCAFGQYAVYRVLKVRSLLCVGETVLSRMVFFVAALLFMLAIGDDAPPLWLTLEWEALGLCVLWWGARIADKSIRIFALEILVAVGIRILFFDSYAGLGPWIKGSLIAAKLACTYGVYLMYRSLKKRSLLDMDESSLLSPLFYVSSFLVVWAIFVYIKEIWVSVSLGAFGVGLFVVGFLIREKVFRHGGFAIFSLTLGRVIFVDLAGLALIYKIISFIVVGILFLGVSFLYTRYSEKMSNEVDDRQ